jgi:hypothetical protein
LWKKSFECSQPNKNERTNNHYQQNLRAQQGTDTGSPEISP